MLGELFNQDFSNPDASDCLLKAQCHQLTTILNKLHNRRQLDAFERRFLLPGQPYSGTLPKFYGLPKVHKVGQVPLRPIIATRGFYADKVVLKMKTILNMCLWGTTAVSNSYELIQILQQYQFGPDDILLSYDVTSLFTRVPVCQTLDLVHRRLEELRELPEDPIANVTSLSNAGIMELLDHVLAQCMFTWDGALYRQSSGLPIGGRLSPILANIFMENLEHEVLCSPIVIPKVFFRYVDDVFLVWDQSRGPHKLFLAELNARNSEIQLTEEVERDQTLPFLDIAIKRPTISAEGPKACAEFAVYRKPTHSARYVHYESAHPYKLKKELVRGLWLRAQRLLAKFPKQRSLELQLLKKTFTDSKNGYPPSAIDAWFRQFEGDLKRRPEMLTVKSRLRYEDIFDENGQQTFRFPTAASRFSQQPEENPNSSHISGLMDSIDADLNWDLAERLELNEDPELVVWDTTQEDFELAPLDKTQEVTVERDHVALAFQEEQTAQLAVLAAQNLRTPILISPFVPIISDQLKKIAAKFDILSWYTYPGNYMDPFTRHRGRAHLSKSRNCVYCTICSCGSQYVGETNRNLKVRLREHLHRSSISSFSEHLRQNTGQAAMLHNTIVLSTESSNLKRKLIESFCIQEKSARLCNVGGSIEIPTIWELCRENIRAELVLMD